MRQSVIVAFYAIAAAAMLTAAAHSAETFIPGGQTYSPDRNSLPPLNSVQDRINLQADIAQSQIYVAERARKMQENELNRFLYNQSLGATEFNRWDY
jgi:hypothetical protein